MRLTPAQIAVRLICGEMSTSRLEDESEPLVDRLKAGREFLVRITGKDFEYDLQAWHVHLKESREGGYTYGRNIVLPKIMQEALASKPWQEAVRELT